MISELHASTPTPLLPCLHVVAGAVFAARWSLTSLYVYDTACRVTNQLSFHSLWWSNDQTNFATSSFVETSLRSLSLKCCKNTPVLLSIALSPVWVLCSSRLHRWMRDEIHQDESERQTEWRRTQQEWQQEWQQSDQQRLLERYSVINAMWISQIGGRQRDRDVERERGKVKERRERERGRGKEKVVAQLRLTLMRSLCDGTWQRRRKQNPPTPMLHNTPPLNWESQSPQRGCVCQKECVSVLGGVSECKTK